MKGFQLWLILTFENFIPQEKEVNKWLYFVCVFLFALSNKMFQEIRKSQDTRQWLFHRLRIMYLLPRTDATVFEWRKPTNTDFTEIRLFNRNERTAWNVIWEFDDEQRVSFFIVCMSISQRETFNTCIVSSAFSLYVCVVSPISLCFLNLLLYFFQSFRILMEMAMTGCFRAWEKVFRRD